LESRMRVLPDTYVSGLTQALKVDWR